MGQTLEPDSAGFHPAFPLVESKLHPLVPPPGTIERPRLIEVLRRAPRGSVVSLLAGPGYGKSTLLAQWAAATTVPVAWLTIDAHDDDPVVLLSYLAAALERIGPIDPEFGTGLWGATNRIHAIALPLLLSSVHRWQRKGVVVLDDVHLLRDPTSLDVVATLLERVPDDIRIAIAARTVPQLPFARLRALRRLVEIGPRLLAMDEVETAALAAATGHRLGLAEARIVAAQTEGWATGIYLSTLPASMQSGEPIGSRPGSEFLNDYLRSEVMAGLAKEDRDFLEQTSVVERVTPAIADELTGTSGSVDRLAGLAQRILLIQKTGGNPPTYRYHNLFRGFLRGELEAREPGAARRFHERAARVYAAEGQPGLAVEHAMASGDRAAAASLVAANSVAAFHTGQTLTVLRWIESFVEADFRAVPSLAVVTAWFFALLGQPQRAESWAAFVEALDYDGETADGSSSFASSRALLRSLIARDGVGAALRDAEFAARAEAETTWASTAYICLTALQVACGKLPEAEATIRTGLARAEAAGRPGDEMVLLSYRSVLAMLASDWLAARRWSEAADEALARSRLDGVITCAFVHAVAARVNAEWAEIESARRRLVQAQSLRLLVTRAIPWLSVAILHLIARSYLELSDVAGAQRAIADAAQIARVRPDLGFLTLELEELREHVHAAQPVLVGSSTLTGAELRILALLPTYLSSVEIADRLAISHNTVKTHITSIYQKLWATSRREAVEHAVEMGLLRPYPALQEPPESSLQPAGA